MLIIGRREWRAAYAPGFKPAPLPAQEVWLHHSVTPAPPAAASLEVDAAAVRLLEQIGQTRFGGGISYTFVVTPSGRVFEGHGIDREGAHTKGRNSRARAICLVGNYEMQHVTERQLAAVVELLGYGHRAGWWRAPRLNGGHRDVPGAATACPGKHAYAAITEINRRSAPSPGRMPADPLMPIPGGTAMDLSDAQLRELLERVRNLEYQLVTGPGGDKPGGKWGWPTFEHGTDENLTLVDYARRNNAEVHQLRAEVAELRELVAHMQTAGVVDMDKLIRAFAEQLRETLGKPAPPQ